MGREIVVHHQYILALLHPEFRDGAAGEGRQMLQPGQTAGLRHDYGGVLQRVILTQRLNGLDHCRAPLADEHVDTVNVLTALVDYGVQGDGAAPQTLIADQQLTLPLADGNHRVDHPDPRI